MQTADVTQLTIYEITVPRYQHDQQYQASVKLREFIPETKRKKGTVAGKGKTTKVKDTGADVSLARGTGLSPSEDADRLRSMSFNTPDPIPGFADTYGIEGLGPEM